MEYVWTSSLWIGIFQRATQGARILLACVASVSNRVIARKLEREQQKKKMEGGGEGGKRKRLPANPTILENAPWYFTIRFIWKLTVRQNRSFTNRLPLDYQICKITLFFNRTCSRRLKKTVIKKVYDKRRLKPWAIATEFHVSFYCVALSRLLSKRQKWFVRNNSLHLL